MSDSDASVATRLIEATTRLLAEEGPSGIKVRAVAAGAGLSTMAVYSTFGGVPELTRAVIDHGFVSLSAGFAALPVTDDPVTDLATMALTCRRIAMSSPHLYDMMFGLSTRATYRPLVSSDAPPLTRTQGFNDAYAIFTGALVRLVASGRIGPHDPGAVTAQLWSLVHGFITLELAGSFIERADPVNEVLLPLGVNFVVGLGDCRTRAERSHTLAAQAM